MEDVKHFVLNGKQRKSDAENVPVVISLLFIEGFPLKGEEFTSCEMRCTLYDLKEHRFIGRTCIKKVNNNINNRKFTISKKFYFYTTVEEKLALVFEISVQKKDSEYTETLGWGIFQLSQYINKDSSSGTPPSSQRISLMFGSPRSLLLIGNPFELKQGDHMLPPKIQATELVYTVQLHFPLLKVLHLIPESILVCESEHIPGLASLQKDTTAEDNFKKPKLRRCTVCILDHITVRILPAISDFEEELLNKIKQDKANQENLPLSDLDVSIVEKRLNIGVHNGWKYVQEKEVCHLIASSFRHNHLELHSSAKGPRIGSGRRKDVKGSTLTLRSRVKLSDIPEDPDIFLVFFLEYVLSFTYATKDRKATTSTVSVCWTRWNPFTENNLSKVSLDFVFSPANNPDEKLIYHTQNVKIVITFLASIGKKQKEIPITASPKTPENIPSKENEITDDNKEVCVKTDSPLKKLPIASPVSENTPKRDSGMKETDLKEVAIINGPQLPIFPVIKQQIVDAQYLSKAAYSVIHNAGFLPICDQHGKPPHSIEPFTHFVVDFGTELEDTFHCNDIVLQFLALSWHETNRQLIPHILFFSFHFYRFPPVKTERLLLESQDGSDFTKPQILHGLESDGTKRDCPPGFQVRYHVDPAYLSPGERKCFLKYLHEHWLHIDVWDGNSLLYIGTASLELKYFCRQGREAVQTMLELVIWQADYFEEPSIENTTNTNTQLQGTLYVKIANIGSPPSVTSLNRIASFPSDDSPVISSQQLNKQDCKSCSITKARPIVELSRDISSFLTSHFANPYSENVIGMSEEKRRKLARMEAVRKLVNDNAEDKDLQKIFNNRVKDLNLLDAYRENRKHKDILFVLQKSITVEAFIHPVLGSSYFFEYELINPFPTEHRIFIECSHPRLSIVSDVKEWQRLRQSWNIEESVEEHLFAGSNILKELPSQIFLHAHEKIRIPFKYHGFLDDSCIPEEWEAASGHVFTTEMLSKYPVSRSFDPFMIKVNFKTEDSRLLYILNLHVQSLPPAVHQKFHFIASENSFLKRWIRLPRAVATPVSGRSHSDINIQCSDDNVVYEIHKSENIREPIDVYLKLACNEAGSEKKFFLFLYGNKFMSKPIQTWLVNVQTVQKIDLSCIVDQSVQSSIVVRGLRTPRLVRCYTSHPMELQLSPNGYFTLEANSLQELQIIAKSTLPGKRNIYVNMVDMEFRTLLRTWLIILICKRPTITKAFQVHLPLACSKSVVKRITFSNPYNYPKTYTLYCSHPELLQLADRQFSLNPKESYPLGLLFIAQPKPIQEEIFIFINNTEGKNEETFSIKLTIS